MVYGRIEASVWLLFALLTEMGGMEMAKGMFWGGVGMARMDGRLAWRLPQVCRGDVWP